MSGIRRTVYELCPACGLAHAKIDGTMIIICLPHTCSAARRPGPHVPPHRVSLSAVIWRPGEIGLN